MSGQYQSPTITPERIREIEKNIRRATTEWLFGLEPQAQILTRALFVALPYTDKLTSTKLLIWVLLCDITTNKKIATHTKNMVIRILHLLFRKLIICSIINALIRTNYLIKLYKPYLLNFLTYQPGLKGPNFLPFNSI